MTNPILKHCLLIVSCCFFIGTGVSLFGQQGETIDLSLFEPGDIRFDADGFARVGKSRGHQGMINQKGQVVLPLIYQQVRRTVHLGQERFWVIDSLGQFHVLDAKLNLLKSFGHVDQIGKEETGVVFTNSDIPEEISSQCNTLWCLGFVDFELNVEYPYRYTKPPTGTLSLQEKCNVDSLFLVDAENRQLGAFPGTKGELFAKTGLITEIFGNEYLDLHQLINARGEALGTPIQGKLIEFSEALEGALFDNGRRFIWYDLDRNEVFSFTKKFEAGETDRYTRENSYQAKVINFPDGGGYLQIEHEDSFTCFDLRGNEIFSSPDKFLLISAQQLLQQQGKQIHLIDTNGKILNSIDIGSEDCFWRYKPGLGIDYREFSTSIVNSIISLDGKTLASYEGRTSSHFYIADKANNLWSLYHKGKFVLYNGNSGSASKAKFDEALVLVAENLFSAKKGDGYGLVDEKGKAVTPFHFGFISKFNPDGFAKASLLDSSSETVGLIDKKGNWVISPKYSAESFYNYYFPERNPPSSTLLDYSPPYVVGFEGKTQLIDAKGRCLLGCD